MKKFSKILSIALLVALVLSLGITSAFAADTGTITITVPTQQTAPTKPVTYKIYKVFDATVNATDNTKVNYTLCSGDTLSAAMTAAGFSVDTAGNVSGPTSLNDAAIAAIAAYVTEADLVETVTAAVGTTSVTSSALPFGYYYITTTTGSVVTIDSNNNNPTVNDKNKIPKVVKSAGTQYDAASMAAIDAVGTSQAFTSQIDVGKGAVNLVFTDTMTNMTFDGTVTITVSAGTAPVAGTDYTLTGEAGASSFSIAFTDAYVASLAENTLINITYSGTITSDALSVDPATNTAKITSGDGNESTSDPVEVYNAKLTVTKQDGDKNPLAGAGFVVKNSEGKYYKLAADKKSITWYELPAGTELADAISAGNITEYTSDAAGAVPAFTGLGVGTYTLVESTVPAGYNKADDIPFEIKDADYTPANLEQTATVTNNAGAELPSTGGIGTTLFYVIGSILVLGAGVVLVAKKRAID
ncbi:MAG: LPXTG cell wall anchor domain-containing protein [Firmicutes bacterium]|nr:LPXTG cell wall anchor domain-containing protein [Bacillota bacterium]